MIKVGDNKFELKSVKTWQGCDGYGLSANLYVNGKKVATVLDEGNGGEMRIDWEYVLVKENGTVTGIKRDSEGNRMYKFPEQTQILIDHVSSLGEKKWYEEDDFSVPYDTALFVDDIFNELEKQKIHKKLEKKFTTCILVGVPGAMNYAEYNFKRNITSIPLEILQKYVDKIKAQMKPGEEILNNNLKSLGVTV
jgi:hypothetical protein